MNNIFSNMLLRLASTAAIIFLLSGAISLSAAEPTPSSSFSKAFGSPRPGVSGSSTVSSPAVTIGQQVKVKGTFEWNNKKGQRNELEGTLTRTSETEWKVTWNFNWGGKPVTYEGIVQGDITNGPISGTGDEIQGKRKFSFDGTAKDGLWKFDCFEVTKDKKAQGNGELTVQK